MAVWSSLAFRNLTKLNISKNALVGCKNKLKPNPVNYSPVRHGHERHFEIKPSRFDYTKFKDLLHFYLMLGIIPIVGLVTYVNIFIGPAELALIPEGYEPEPYEYHRHPISRFFAKYITRSPQEKHERNCHNVFYINEKKNIRLLSNKIRNLIKEREDYQTWYYDKPLVKYGRRMREDADKIREGTSTVGGWIM